MKQFFNNIVSRLNKNPHYQYLVLLPFFLGYLILITTGLKDGFRKDEWRYIYYAQNLIQGEYSPSGTVFLWNGPGYPLLLTIFISFKLSLTFIKALNAVFLYFALIFFYKSVIRYFPVRQALLATVVLGLYLPAYEMLPYIMTEPLTICLTSGVLWAGIAVFNDIKFSMVKLVRLAVLLAGLALTKVIFGYVIVMLLALMFLYHLVKRSTNTLKAIIVLSLSLIICFPYLGYTYHISGKIFYWSNAGGMQLYWMSTPFKGEYGDWINFTVPVSNYEDVNRLFEQRHGKIINELFDYPELFSGIKTDELVVKSNLSQDEGFKRYAIENIKKHPTKYFKNWKANISRMLFDIPYSYKTQSTRFLKYVFFHIPLIIVLLIGIVMRYRSGKPLSFLTVFLGLFVTIYLGGSSIVSAYPRQFYITIPILLFWVTAIALKFGQPESYNKR